MALSLRLPASVQELNMNQSLRTPILMSSPKKPGFEDIPVEKRYNREASLPNGVENWNINNFDSYLHFDDHIGNDFDVLVSSEDRLVPETEQRDRCGSISSVSSSVEDKQPIFHNFGVKTFKTVGVDSGSTCTTSDHTYGLTDPLFDKALDPEETYQNLDLFCLQEVPELKTAELLTFSPISSSSSSETNFETRLLPNYPSTSTHNEDSYHSTISRASKRPLDSTSEDEVFIIKHTKQEYDESEDGEKYTEIRRKNNIASKNCRKTRREKQKDMEVKVTELEQERENLKVQVQVLEQLIEAHKQCLLNAIANKR